MKFLILASILALSFSSNAYSDDCAARNKVLAQSIIDSAAKAIDHTASEVVASSSIYESGDRFEFFGSIYKAEYMVIVKTDTSCFPKEVELVDLATR